MKKYSGEIGLMIAAIIWGSGFVGTQLALNGGLTPLQILTIRFFIAALILSLVFIKKIKLNMSKEILKAGSILGVFLFLAFVTQTIGLKYTTPSKNAFITATSVVLVPFIGFIINKEKLHKIGVISSIVALIGIGILSLESDFSVNIGDILTLLCAVGFAFHIVFISKYVVVHDPFTLTTIQFVVAFILSLVTQVFIGEGSLNAEISGYLGALYLAIFSTIIGFLIQTVCQKKVDSNRTILILSTEAVFATIFSIFILGEIITLRLVIGSILIFTSIIAAETNLSFVKKKKNKQESKNDIANNL